MNEANLITVLSNPALQTRSGLPVSIAYLKEDLQGNITSISGTINVPASPAIPASPGKAAIPATQAGTISIEWNVSGMAASVNGVANRAYDLVITKPFTPIATSK